MKKEEQPESRYEKAVSQSKKLRKKELENQKILSVIERNQNKIEKRLHSKELQKIETGFILSNGNKLSLVEPLPKSEMTKKNTLLEKFNRILKSITE